MKRLLVGILLIFVSTYIQTINSANNPDSGDSVPKNFLFKFFLRSKNKPVVSKENLPNSNHPIQFPVNTTIASEDKKKSDENEKQEKLKKYWDSKTCKDLRRRLSTVRRLSALEHLIPCDSREIEALKELGKKTIEASQRSWSQHITPRSSIDSGVTQTPANEFTIDDFEEPTEFLWRDSVRKN